MNAQKFKYTIIIGLATVCLCFSAVATAKELRVPSEYNTIQSAIDAAFPMDTVIVAKGIYSESIAVKTGLKVIGAGKEVTTITASNGDSVVQFDNASFRTEFRGFTIDGQGGNLIGINATNNSSPNISDVAVKNVGSEGIYCRGNLTISNVDVAYTGSYGIYCRGSLTLSNAEIDRTGSHGIYCGSDSTIDSATISNAGNNGIFCSDFSNITNCEITRSRGDGIECSSGGTKITKIRKCIVVQNLQNGIYATGRKEIDLGTTSDPGQNEIYNNAKFDVFNETRSKIKALGNWWGQAPPNPQFISGEVDYGQWLTEPPLSGAKEVERQGAIPQNILSQLETERSKRWAVLIGINQYQDTKLSSLKYAVNDVKDVYSTLTDPQVGSFDKERVHLLIEDSEQTSTLGESVLKEPTFPNIWDSLNSVVKTTQPDDKVFIYFSGHGIEEGDQTWLLASDSRLSMLDRTAIQLDEVNRILSECQADSKILILDACHSGAVKDKGGSGTMTSDFKDTAFTAITGRATLSSSGLNESSYDHDEKRHSAFTYFLLEGLKGKADSNADNIVSLTEISDYVKTEVPKWGFKSGKQQTPMFNSYITGEIVLTGCSRQ